jgi:hypothetical protein
MSTTRDYWRNQLRLTALEFDSRNLLSAIKFDLEFNKNITSRDSHAIKGIIAFCSDERLGTVILNWAPLKRYLREAGTGLAGKYIGRIEGIEEKLWTRRYF